MLFLCPNFNNALIIQENALTLCANTFLKSTSKTVDQYLKKL